jgi:hypothetical protein
MRKFRRGECELQFEKRVDQSATERVGGVLHLLTLGKHFRVGAIGEKAQHRHREHSQDLAIADDDLTAADFLKRIHRVSHIRGVRPTIARFSHTALCVEAHDAGLQSESVSESNSHAGMFIQAIHRGQQRRILVNVGQDDAFTDLKRRMPLFRSQ